MRRVIFDHTHVYVGAKAKFNFRPMPDCAYLEVEVEFIDGASSICDIESSAENEIIMYISGYTTAAGTLIDAKVWKLINVEGDLWKVASKIENN